MNIVASVFYLITAALLFAHLFFLRKSGERQNAVLWLAVCILFYECWLALAGGVLSLAHIPVTLVTIGVCNLLVCAALRWFAARQAAGRGRDIGANHGDSSGGSAIGDDGTGPCATETVPVARGLSGLFSRGFPLQAYTVRGVDIALAVCLGAVVFAISWERFATDAPIIYATIDPVDRLSAAQHAMVAETVIYTYPNMFFGHMANAMFMQLLDPFFHGIYAFRAFQIKESINLWLAGLLFYSALRQYSGRNFACGFFFLLTFAYTLGYPWNNQLFGFGYLGTSVTLIIFVAIGAKLLLSQEAVSSSAGAPSPADGASFQAGGAASCAVRPWAGLAVISAGCLGVGISYTLFAPPVYIAAFIAITLYFVRRRRASDETIRTVPIVSDETTRTVPVVSLPALCLKRILPAEIAVFAIPVVFTVVFTMIIESGERIDTGSQLTQEGAIFRNLYSDFLPWLPFALFAIVLAARSAHRDFARIFAVIFIVYQAYFFVRMWQGSVSTYYYFKMNFVLWFIVLFLAGIAVTALSERLRGKAMIACYTLIWAIVAVVGVNGYEARLTARNQSINPVTVPAAGVSFQVYSTNNLYFSDLSKNVVYVDWDFVDLCKAARELRGSTDASNFFENRVETVADDFKNAYWVDCLVNEHIEQQPVTGIFELPQGDAKIWVVFKNSELYKNNQAYIDSLPRAYENVEGFVVTLP